MKDTHILFLGVNPIQGNTKALRGPLMMATPSELEVGQVLTTLLECETFPYLLLMASLFNVSGGTWDEALGSLGHLRKISCRSGPTRTHFAMFIIYVCI